jgi:hypothetical protein
MAKRGYSRDSRPDCVQVCIGLVVTTDGIPLGYEVFGGNTGDSTTVEEIVEAMEAKYGRSFPAACGVLAKDLADCLTFYRFPQEHWKRLRTSNVIERAFREVRRRTDMVGRFPGEMAALVLIWATLEEDRLVWRGVRMDGDLRLRIVEASRTAAESIDVSALDRYLEAA